VSDDLLKHSYGDNDHKVVHFFLGPKITGDLEFDKHCVFASNIDLTGRQIADLNAMVAKLRPTVP
jgi:hypothetical protein